ncbi:hypothetical protein K3X41_12530 [Aliiroseovarius crassostreae]|uniref:hypothetical protein n=1 Tax=Aliiroseovarius crassostreae TaxID=154981 RepID=UPI0021FC4E91|nr:hypothetical protein [Aliiroseovarius crassostreae]UWQ07593.1 hypothetical protein K3X25_12650 [Aliiroseovarius crassostreae]UWQ10698.1 hypothetical protein K3X41_12530 [Aliiroseovarius crassostreae]
MKMPTKKPSQKNQGKNWKKDYGQHWYKDNHAHSRDTCRELLPPMQPRNICRNKKRRNKYKRQKHGHNSPYGYVKNEASSEQNTGK